MTTANRDGLIRTVASAITLTAILTACQSGGQPPQPNTSVSVSRPATNYGVPTSGVNDLKLSCRLTSFVGVPEYEPSFDNLTSYSIQVNGWRVILHNRNGTSYTESYTSDFEVDGKTSVSWPTDMPTQLVYSAPSGWRTVATSCQVLKVW